MKRNDNKNESWWKKLGRFLISDIPLKLIAFALAFLTFMMISI